MIIDIFGERAVCRFKSSAERRVLISTRVFTVAGFLGIDIHLASLPVIMKFMHTDKVHMQQSISIYLLGMGVSMLFYGPISDKYGRRPIILFGLIVGRDSRHGMILYVPKAFFDFP